VILGGGTEKFRVLKSMIISFDTIQLIDKKTTLVVLRKFISDDKILTGRIFLVRIKNGYNYLKCEFSGL